MSKPYDALWVNARIVTCDQLNPLDHAAIAVKDGRIAWIGELSNLPHPQEEASDIIYDVNDLLITPGLIDCHTHVVYAGNRAHEFTLRLEGKTYAEIAQAGGGIQSTVKATRIASEDELLAQSLPRAQSLMQSGVTTLEIKSGYGLDWNTECKMLRVAGKIQEELGLEVHRTFLGAHTVPIEYKTEPEKYVDLVCNEMIPKIAEQQLAESVDVFCETIAFNLNQTEKIFRAAAAHHLKIKCHAEQLSASGAAALAARYSALSVDHLEFLNPSDISALAKHDVVAVLLPGAFYFLREKQLPPIAALKEAKVPIALASDCNPGTSPIASLTLIMNMACTLFGFTPIEALLAVTKGAAIALNLEASHGSLKLNNIADFAVWDVKSPDELAYFMGTQPLKFLVKKGEIIYRSG